MKKLLSVNCAISEESIIYPLLDNGHIDLDDEGTYITDVSQEWIDKLSNEDKAIVYTTHFSSSVNEWFAELRKNCRS